MKLFDCFRYRYRKESVVGTAGWLRLPSTIIDRSVVIPLRRKTNNETILRIEPDLHAAAESTRSNLLKWMIDHHHSIKKNTIEPPNLGNDRAVDNWLSLFTIANQVGPEWLKKCEIAYRLLNDYEDEPPLSSKLRSVPRYTITSNTR